MELAPIQRHKFSRAEASRVILSLANGICSGFQDVFSSTNAMLFCQNIDKTWNNAVKMSQVFQHIAWFELFTDLNLFKYAFNVIQNWERGAVPFYSIVLFFVSSYG